MQQKLKKMPSAAQWNILYHPSAYGTKITGIQNFGHLCLSALYLQYTGVFQEHVLYRSQILPYVELLGAGYRDVWFREGVLEACDQFQ